MKQTKSTEYNPELAYYLCALSRAAYDRDDIEKSLNSLCFDGIMISPNYDREAFGNELVAYSIATKTLANGEKLVLIPIRGSLDIDDWKSDFNLGISNAIIGYGVHNGFGKAADDIYKNLYGIAGGVPTAGVTYVITGHSRGGAVGNLLTVLLSANGVPQENIYNYNFACPDVACGSSDAWNRNGRFSNIFNIN